MTNPNPGERIKTEIDDRGVTLTDTATGLTVTNNTSRDMVENVSRACDDLGKKLAEWRLAGYACIDCGAQTGFHTPHCPTFGKKPAMSSDNPWVFTWSRIEKSSDVAVGPAGAILRHDIQRFRIRYFRIGMTDRWEVIAYTEGDNHIVSKTHSTLESAQEDLKTLIGATE